MNGHPAIAYIVARQMLEERREEASQHRKAESAPKSHSLKLGRYWLTLQGSPPGLSLNASRTDGAPTR